MVALARPRLGRLRFSSFLVVFLSGLLLLNSAAPTHAADGVFARFKLVEPADARYFVKVGGHIHVDPWYLPGQIWPAAADKQEANRLAAGAFTPWFDVRQYAGPKLHGRMKRAGGIAEFPNITAQFVTGGDDVGQRVVIELATAADEKAVVKRFGETLPGNSTSFLVSPDLAKDAGELETLGQMADRHLLWARQATGGQRVAPKDLLLQTSFFGSGTPQDFEAVWLLGFNVVGNLPAAMAQKYPELRTPGHSHDVDLGPAASKEAIDANMKKLAAQNKPLAAGLPFGFADEICARPPMGDNPVALAEFRAWLAAQKIAPQDLGVSSLDQVAPIEDPPQLRERQKSNPAAATRIFYYSSRYRQIAGTQRLRWNTEAFHRHFPPGPITSTLVADHPYFSGTGLGMGMSLQNTTWGGWPLALDWFDIARHRAVDMIGVEDWMGLQYMYGPSYTWEGPQLMGFQSAIFRSGSGGKLPIMAWITPSDEQGFLLKATSALAQGAKHLFFWTYGPTCQSTENYWSDLPGAYPGFARYSRQLAGSEKIIAPGATRPSRVALLYSISADLWQPFGYIHMLERRATYLALVHNQYLVDMVTEEDVLAGRLKDYDALYVTDANIAGDAAAAIESWVSAGGWLYGSCAAGSRNQFDEAAPGLAKAFGIEPAIQTTTQAGRYHVRGALNQLDYVDQIQIAAGSELGAAATIGVLGAKTSINPTTSRVLGMFQDGKPAVVVNTLGKGKAVYFAACPGLSYLKDARFAPTEFKEVYPPTQRRLISAVATARGVPRLVELSHPVVEAGLYDSPQGTALVLANFTYQPIEKLTARVPVARVPKTIKSLQHGAVPFTSEDAPAALQAQGYVKVAVFTLPLGVNDVVLLE